MTKAFSSPRAVVLLLLLPLLVGLACNLPTRPIDERPLPPTSADTTPNGPTATPDGLVLPTEPVTAEAGAATPTTAPGGLAPTATPRGTDNGTPTRGDFGDGTVNTSRLNVRRGPGVSYDVITVVSRGDVLQLMGIRAQVTLNDIPATWVEVLTPDGGIGWINSRFLDTTADIDSFTLRQE